MKRFKRSLAGLLVLVMVLGQLPVLAGAEGLCEHHTAHEDCGYVEGEAPCTFACEECTQVPVEPEAPALSTQETDTTELDRVQGMIDALPDAMTAETQAELLAYKETLDAAISALGAEQIALLDLSKYNAVYNAPMEADTYGVWEYYTNPDGDGGYYAVITGYNGSGGSVTIPNTINGAKVIHASFYGTSASITSITCGSYLESVPDIYGAGDSLKSVNLSAATIEEIDTDAFYGCENLKTFYWPKGVKVIGDGAFAATGLTSVSIPSTVVRIGGPAAGSNYTSGTGVFEDCEKLTSVTFSGTSLTEIRASTFEDCIALKSIKIPGGVTSIGDYAFSGCTALTSVNWGTSQVTRIGKYAFMDCTALTELTLPAGVTSLGDYCFADSGITALHLPDSLLSVTGAPFQWASKLQELTVNSTNYSYKSVDGVLFNKAGTRLVCYPAGKPSVSRYQIPDGVTTIGREAFGGRWSSQNIYCVYGNISNLCFPDTVTRVEENGAAYYSGNFYFCGDKPATTDIFDLGNNRGVTHYYTPGRTGWTEGTYVKPWPDLDHCTTRTQTVIDATCTTAGGYQYVCDICGYTCCDGKGTPALDHDWSEWEVLKDPICTIDGLRQRFCLRDGCDAMEEEVTPALGHAWTTLLCTEEATCNECSEVRPAGEHNWEEASCTEPKHCTKCPLTEGEALGHEIVIDARVEPTCTAAGKTEGKHCSRCKEVLVAQTTLAATGHTEVIDPAVPATQRLTGLTEGKHCSACGLVLVAQKKTAATGSHTKHAVCQERCDHEEPHEIVTFNQWYGSFKSGNYYMTSDRTISYNLTITGDAHLCLNGHTLTIADGYSLKVEYGGSLTICDCAGGGQIIRGTLAGNGDGSMILNRGTMLIGGGTIGADGHGVDLYNTGDLTIYGGTFGIEISNYYDDWSSSTTRYGKTVIYDATVCTQLYTNDDAIVNDKGCSLTIYGGDFSATGNALWNKGTANVLGGTFRTLEDGDTLNRESTIENTGRLELRNATVSSPDGNALSNNGYYTSTVNGTYVWGNVSIYEGTTLTSESTIWPTVSNSCYLNVYGGSISGYIGIENDSSFSGTTKNGGDVYIGGGTITGTKCAILNSGNTSTSYQNGVATGYKFSRGMLEINYAPNIGKIILEYPSSLVMDNSLSATLDVELDMDYIALGDTISTGNTNKMGNINLLNEGYILLYDYYKDIYLDSSHIGATASDPLYWKYDAQGKVTIYGSGRMKNFGSSYDQPWKKEKTLVDVTEVVMEPGITYIGGYAFAFLYKVTSITIPEGVTAVGDRVLAGNNLETVYLPSTLTTIGRYFFATNSNSVPPKEVYYNGCEHQWANVTVDSTQPVPVEPICLPNANADDNDCTTAFVCSVCALEVVPARQAHTGGTATCESLAQCEVCGKEYGELGHEAVTDAAVAPTCTETGLEEGSHCGLCGAVLVEQVVIPVLGHVYEATVTDPTCTEDGFTTHTCANCGDSYQDTVVPALGHFALQPGKELVDSCTMQNDATYPFTLSGGWYASSNKGHDTKSVFQLKATYDCTLVLAYKVSSEKNYDKLQVLLNGTTKATISGVVSERTITLELKAGDIAAVQYRKDVSASQNADTGYFRIVSCTQTELDTLERVPAEEVQPTCTEGVVCDTCGETVKAALGHTDGDRDHLCDNNCGEVMGEHKDSPDDDDHLCDHCQGEEILEKCHDGDDADYNCDICGAELPSTGDVDLDGGVDSDDLTLLARHVGGIELLTDPRALANADTNADGLVNSDDLTKHARFVGGIITDWTQE